jgi:hypothetical protein
MHHQIVRMLSNGSYALPRLRDPAKKHEVFQDYLQARHDWKKTCVYVNVTSKTATRKRGRKAMKTLGDIRKMYEHEEDADMLVSEVKMLAIKNGETEPHPSFPTRQVGFTTQLKID